VKHFSGDPLYGKLLALLRQSVERVVKSLIYSSLTEKHNKLERWPELTRVSHLSGAPLEGRLLALPTNIRLGWKGLPEDCIIKLITAVIYGFRNKLVFVPKHWTRLETLARDKHSSLLRKP
jgi:hypothetical protein